MLTRRSILLGAATSALVLPARAAGLLPPKQLGSDGVAGRQAIARFQDAINFRDYLLPTDTQSSDAIDRMIALQSTTAFTGRPRPLYFPAGVYPPLIRTHKFAPYSTLYGDGGAEQTIFTRTFTAGSTFQFGDNPATNTGGSQVPAGRVVVRGLQLIHGTPYVPGNTTLNVVATTGAHLELNGPQGGEIEGCILQRMPYSILVNGGPGGVRIGDNKTIGVWDDVNSGCQEGVASVRVGYSTLWGNPKDITFANFYGQGQKSASRSKTWSDTAGHSVSVTGPQNIGFQNNILITGCETVHVLGGYLGAANVNNITVTAAATSGSLVRNIHIGGGVYLDSGGNAQIAIQSANAASIIDNLEIGDCTMNGEANGLLGLLISAAADASGPSVTNAKITPSVIEHHVGAGMVLAGLAGGYIGGGCRITDYNCLNIPSTADAQRDAAIYVTGSSRDLLLDQMSLGGGGLYDAATAAGGNNSHRGVVVDPSLSSAGITVGSNVRFAAPT